MKRLWACAILMYFCCAGQSFSRFANTVRPSFAIDYRSNTFLLDGKPFRYIAGSIHYFRVHPDYWDDRLRRIRAAGLNAIQLYIPWNFHEVYKGRYLFNSQRNITHFIELAARNQLFVLARIGPYVCGEWENGGLPWWLIRDYKDIKQRTSDPRYLKEVERWFSVLLPILYKYLRKNGGPILMVQPENEYGSHYACDHTYMKWLSDVVRRYFGTDVIQYTTDGSSVSYLKCGTIPGVYPTIDFGPTSRKNVNAYFAAQRQYAPFGPLVNSEFYPGWLVVWGQRHQQLPSIAQIIDTADYMYQLGANFNFYMFYGGTNFGYWNGAETKAPVITSYDYTAPLSEAGDITAKYIAIRNWLASKPDWPYRPSSIPPNNPKSAYGRVKLRNVLPLGRHFWKLAAESNSCVGTKYPLSFEDLGHPFGFVIYYTELKFGGANLTIPLLKDHGFVLLDDQPQGVFVNIFGNYSKRWIDLIGARSGAKLGILVENRGRQTIPTINDFKGILTNVTLDGRIVDDWIQCGLPAKLVDWMVRRSYNWRYFHMEDKRAVGLFVGHFEADRIADTYFNPAGWGKGQLYINGRNLGRYWPSVGPQVTLYVPAPYLKRHNTIVLLELERAGNCNERTCVISLIDYPIFNFTDNSRMNGPVLWPY